MTKKEISKLKKGIGKSDTFCYRTYYDDTLNDGIVVKNEKYKFLKACVFEDETSEDPRKCVYLENVDTGKIIEVSEDSLKRINYSYTKTSLNKALKYFTKMALNYCNNMITHNKDYIKDMNNKITLTNSLIKELESSEQKLLKEWENLKNVKDEEGC